MSTINKSVEYAFELTKLAIENKMVRLGTDNKSTADNIADFYEKLQTRLLETINKSRE